jgi:hypothetical protein
MTASTSIKDKCQCWRTKDFYCDCVKISRDELSKKMDSSIVGFCMSGVVHHGFSAGFKKSEMLVVLENLWDAHEDYIARQANSKDEGSLL